MIILYRFHRWYIICQKQYFILLWYSIWQNKYVPTFVTVCHNKESLIDVKYNTVIPILLQDKKSFQLSLWNGLKIAKTKMPQNIVNDFI